MTVDATMQGTKKLHKTQKSGGCKQNYLDAKYRTTGATYEVVSKSF